MNSHAIRRAFIEYFVERDHLHLPGLPLVTGDPSVTTLFTIAGMQQMIPYFMGREQPPNSNMVTVQRAVRTNDIDEVGDDRHLTFLEMLGNFSVGQYFKQEAVAYTWDFLVNRMEIPAERWWAVTYPGDEDARGAWLGVGMPAERIGATKDNWWGPPGPAGPCGPNSEIHYDRGVQHGCGGDNCRPETECCDRFLEVWNDVFMSFYQDENGERRPLPWNNIDTGMGFERLVSLVQGVPTPYETDLFQPIIQALTTRSGATYGQDQTVDLSLRIISDHCRAAAFIIADGVMPSSQARGYVLRRLIRRASLHGHLLGITEPFLTEPVGSVIDSLEGSYEILRERRNHIELVIREEERRFLLTLERGLGIYNQLAEAAKSHGRPISGNDAFVLYDTHGFPFELTAELAAVHAIEVDRPGFEQALQEQQSRSQRGRTTRNISASPEIYAALASSLAPTVFTGYEELETASTVSAILSSGEQLSLVCEGDDVQVLLSTTPFYAESGGQVGDTGTIRTENGKGRVTDTVRPYAGLIVHQVTIEEGTFEIGDIAHVSVDAERRLHILSHHSSTHLLHKALQEVLGPGATQAGSLVAPDRLRFDFQWARPMTAEELRDVQDRVNAAIWANLPVTQAVIPYDEAIAQGAMALFGEKYGDLVRVVSMGEWSKELCGGTHVGTTGDIGLLLVTSETGIGSGIRRIEALAGAAAYSWVNGLRQHIQDAASALDTSPEALVPRARAVSRELRSQERRAESLARALAAREAEALVNAAETVDGFALITHVVEADTAAYLKDVTDAVKSRLGRGVVVLASVVDNRPVYTAAVSHDLANDGYSAKEILQAAARSAQIGGGAGGKSEFAQGGGRDASRVKALLDAVDVVVRQRSEQLS